jgi:small subunit ribosomal protein S2
MVHLTLLTKKEASLRYKELQKLRKHLDGIKNMDKLPDVAILIDQKREMTAIKECRKLRNPYCVNFRYKL